jgi:Tfp pilus assembly protein PilX
MKNPIKNQRGIALIATLMLLVLGFAVVVILFRLSTQETKLARLEQGYATALDAAKGVSDLFMFMVQNGSYQATSPALPFGATRSSCLQTKMAYTTSSWSAQTGWPAISTTSTTAPSAISSDPTDTPDITLNLSNYTINLKVIDNSVTAASGGNPCYHGCYYYTVVARAQAPGGSGEHADILFVYRYDAP